MSAEVTTAEKIRRLPWNTTFHALNTVFTQLTFFGSAFVLFLNELGASNAQIGFLLAMLPFTGIIALFVAPWVARYGYKRTYVTFYGFRKIITMGLLFVPLVIQQYGTEAALTLVSVVVFGFALCRSISETGFYPWVQEYIPDSMRGKHAALNDMVSRLTGIAAVAVGGYLLALSTGVERFTSLFMIGLIFGALGVWAVSHLPGGAPVKTQPTAYRDLLNVLRDKNFTRYLAGLATTALAGAPLAFIPLFMRNQVGLSDSSVVWLQTATIGGGLSITYLMGWAADRYGSKPVMLSGLAAKTLLPLAWLFMPRNTEHSIYFAVVIASVWGMIEIAWAIGSGRLLFTRVVPRAQKGEYMAVFYATVGLIGGMSQILSGVILDATANISGQIGGFVIDQFTPLFIASMIMNAISLLIFRRVHTDSSLSVLDFAGMFIHGNAVLALQNVMRYYRARDERTMVEVTQRMGSTNSPLAVDELLASLTDPRFNVRFEAIYAISHRDPDPRLVEALSDLLDSGTELSLSVIAAWGLGRMGDPAALPSLRRALDSPWRSIQSHAARALGMLGDISVGEILLTRLQNEPDKGLRIAYASALGQMRYQPAQDILFEVLRLTENRGACMELALAIARLYDGESRFIRFLRSARHDPGTTFSQAITSLKRHLRRMDQGLVPLVENCASPFARNQFTEGITHLIQMINEVAKNRSTDLLNKALSNCAVQMSIYGMERNEYVLLALVLLQESVSDNGE